MIEGWYSQNGLKIHYYRPDPNPLVRIGAGKTSLCGQFWLQEENAGEGWEAPVKVDILTMDIKKGCKTCLQKRHPGLSYYQKIRGKQNE